MNVQQSAIPVLVVLIPLVTSLVLPVLGWWYRPAVFPVALAGLAVTCGTAIIAAYTVVVGGPLHYYLGGWAPPWGIEFRIDSLSVLMLVLLTVITLLIGIYSKHSVLKEIPSKEVPFYTVYLLLVTGLAGLVSTADMFNLYVFLEITSLTSYALVSLGGGAAVVSAFRYVILGTVGAAFYLLAVGYLYSMTGTLNMADLARILPGLYSSTTVLVGFAFFVIGVSIKMALFPMHSWLPGAYSDAPSAVSALIAATTTKVAAYVLIRVMFFVFEPRFSIDVIPVTTVLAWMGSIAMILGSVMAIGQHDFKRMLAYSSVAQIGYIVLGVGLANEMGFTGGVLHIVNHAFMKGGLFLVAGAIVYRTGVREIRGFRNLSGKMPVTAATFTLCAFAMVGIPPTGGFFSKLYLILGAINAGQWVFVAVIVLSSVLALAYLFNVLRFMYFPRDIPLDPEAHPSPSDTITRDEAPWTMLGPMIAVAAGIVLLGLFNGEIVRRFIEPVIPVGLGR